MKKPFLFVTSILLITTCFAQTSKAKRPYLSITVGKVTPLGAFKDINVPSDNGFQNQDKVKYIKGGASTGYSLKIEAAHFIVPCFGLGGKISHSLVGVDVFRIQNEIDPNETYVTTTVNAKGNYSFTQIGAGMVPSIPFSKFSIDAKLFVTYFAATAPDYEFYSNVPAGFKYYTNYYDALRGGGMGVDCGVALRALLSKKLSFVVEANYFSGEINLKVNNTTVDVTPSKSNNGTEIELKGYNILMGLAYSIQKQKD